MPSATLPIDKAKVSTLLARAAGLRQSGALAESIRPQREAARLDPGNYRIQHDLGLACLECSQLNEAVVALQRCVTNNPRFAEGFWRLGLAYERMDQAAAAIASYRQAVALKPSLSEAQYGLANLLEHLGHRTEAIRIFRKAASTARKSTLRRIATARAFLVEGNDAEAEKLLRQIVALDPGNAVAWENLGNILANAGRFPEAAGAYERTVDVSPRRSGLYYDIVRTRRLTPEDAGLMARIKAAFARSDLNIENRCKLHLALGKAADDLGNYREAMHQFGEADAERRSAVPFDAATFEARTARMITQFTPELVSQASAVGSDDATPVLILGMPRSGTTLLEQIVSSHRDVAAAGELPFWDRRGRMMEEAGPSGIEASFVAEVSAAYGTFIRRNAPDAARITDKNPFNFLWAGYIYLCFPHATIIHCRRTPVDIALSIHQTFFNFRLAMPTGGDELVRYYRAYERLTAHWRAVLPPDRFIEVEYEKLVAEPEPEIRRVIAACGLSWDDACLQPERNDRVVKTASKWQARQPIYRESVERWRNYEPYLGPLRALV